MIAVAFVALIAVCVGAHGGAAVVAACVVGYL